MKALDDEAKAALEELHRQVNLNLSQVVLERGDLLLIDNFRAVHGRRAFPARFDGRDRWLIRSYLVRDLRRLRALRATASSLWIREEVA
jgi:alpha-ketoglutarate-dependent taurine dioxygenase